VVGALADERTAAWIGRLVEVIAARSASAAVDAALRRAASPENQRFMQESAAAMADAFARASVRAVASELPNELGPAMGEMVQKDFDQGLRGMSTSPEVRGALSAAAFELARQAVLGANEATTELSRNNPKAGLFGNLRAILVGGGTAAFVGVGFLVLTIFVLAVMLLRTRARVRRHRAEPEPGERPAEGGAWKGHAASASRS
jgi:hypothetical protein